MLILICLFKYIKVLGYEKFTIITLSNAGRDGDGDGDGEGWGGAGLKSLNPSPPRPAVRGENLAPSPPHCLCGVGKTRARRSGERRVKRGREKLPSLLQLKSDPLLLDITERTPNKGAKMSTSYKQFYHGLTNDPLFCHYIYTYNTILPI